MKNEANLQELSVVYVEDDDYLNKPISIDSLCEAIEKLTKL